MTTLRLAALAALLLASGATPALADTAYDKCINESDGTNPAWDACGAAFVQREDGKLNAAWKRLFALAEGQTKADLLAEQRLWIQYKEAACAFYANGDQGREGQVLSYPACKAEVLANRTETLKGYEQSLSPQ